MSRRQRGTTIVVSRAGAVLPWGTTTVDAAGQTNTYAYNARGQLLAETNPKNETTTYTYDSSGYRTTIDGPLPGTNDVIMATYDEFGRRRSLTGLSGYTVLFDYDALDRLVRVTHPDSTFTQYTYDRLDLVHVRDRDGQATCWNTTMWGSSEEKRIRWAG